MDCEAVVLMTAPVFEDASPIELDSVPDLDDIEYPCSVCGRESGPYSGRGRRPTKCPEHKQQRATGTGRGPRRTNNDTLAAQASAVLVQLNQGLAITAMAMGFNGTASAIAHNNDAFETNAFEALKTDPELCKFICKGGVKSGKVALAMAYASLGTQVVPVAAQEFKAKRAAAKAAKEAREAEMTDGLV